MNPILSRTEILYDQVRLALQSGQYLPGQRIDPAALAAEFDTSDMPVRLVLQRLVGARLLDLHDRGSVRLPLPSEVELRERYDLMGRLLVMSCDIDLRTITRKDIPHIEITSADDDLVNLTGQLFDAIALATDQEALYGVLKHYNDWLAPIRRSKRHLIDDAFEELTQLNRHWQQRDIPSLKTAIHDYFERRKRLAPHIVTILNRQNSRLN